jgi:hypothetical protein
VEYVTIAETATNKKTDPNSTDRQNLLDIDLSKARRNKSKQIRQKQLPRENSWNGEEPQALNTAAQNETPARRLSDIECNIRLYMSTTPLLWYAVNQSRLRAGLFDSATATNQIYLLLNYSQF